MRNSVLVVLATVTALPGLAHAKERSDLKALYRTPPTAVRKLVDRPPTPSVSISPDASHMVIGQYPAFKTIDELSQPELGLAGRQLNPRTNGPSRDTHFTKFSIMEIATRKQKRVKGIPRGERLGGRIWAPDSSKFAFTVTRKDGIALYVADVDTAVAKRVTDYQLNAAVGSPCDWLPDSERLVCRMIPKSRGEAPERPEVPTGPVIQESTGEKAPARTYTYLLEDEHDEKLFDHYFAAQVSVVSAGGGKPKTIGKPGIVIRAAASPNGNYLLVQTLRRPYSYLVPLGRFPRRTEVWSLAGKVIRRVADEPLKENVPIAFGSVPDGRRSIGWRADADATLHFTEALDGGDARAKAKLRDRVFTWKAPFRGKPKKLVDTALRYGGVTWGTGNLALVREWWWSDRRIRTWIIAPDKPRKKKRLLWDRSWEDRYNDPGNPVTERNERGHRVLKSTGGESRLFLIGTGASEEGNRPFVDTIDLKTKKTERLWRSEAPFYEYPIRILDDSGEKVLTRRESKKHPPNYCILNTKTKKPRAVTRFPHPHPELRRVKKELIRYERKDGVMLTATLYTPPGWTKKKGRLPVILWAYPREFKSADAAGQVTDSPYRFSRVGWWSPLVWLLRGYAVLEGPTMPIVGEGETEPNDTYVEQLVASARAAVDEVVRRGVGDRKRIAIGGHSYGAFMTANLLAHSDLFRAGIARSGAYNRTLTPFGFQAEERTFWEAPETYFEMSPFMHADKIDEPLLLIHGEADPNAGTYPMQSERLYNAIKGHGGQVRLVMLPHEGHGYRARASIMHMLWETSRWLDQHVKKKKRAPKKRRAPKQPSKKK